MLSSVFLFSIGVFSSASSLIVRYDCEKYNENQLNIKQRYRLNTNAIWVKI